MNWEEEVSKFEARYKEILSSDLLIKRQKKDVKEIKKKLEGHLYDPTFLVDWVRTIPFVGLFNKGWKDEEVILDVVGVLHSDALHEFYYIGFDQDGELHLELCLDRYDNISKSQGFQTLNIEEMKKKIKMAMFPDDKVLMFKPYDKQIAI